MMTQYFTSATSYSSPLNITVFFIFVVMLFLDSTPCGAQSHSRELMSTEADSAPAEVAKHGRRLQKPIELISCQSPSLFVCVPSGSGNSSEAASSSSTSLAYSCCKWETERCTRRGLCRSKRAGDSGDDYFDGVWGRRTEHAIDSVVTRVLEFLAVAALVVLLGPHLYYRRASWRMTCPHCDHAPMHHEHASCGVVVPRRGPHGTCLSCGHPSHCHVFRDVGCGVTLGQARTCACQRCRCRECEPYGVCPCRQCGCWRCALDPYVTWGAVVYALLLVLHVWAQRERVASSSSLAVVAAAGESPTVWLIMSCVTWILLCVTW
eukprot:PhM_4_TR13255/c0_g1_i1/m.100903